jgi:hypothetical protein
MQKTNGATGQEKKSSKLKEWWESWRPSSKKVSEAIDNRRKSEGLFTRMSEKDPYLKQARRSLENFDTDRLITAKSSVGGENNLEIGSGPSPGLIITVQRRLIQLLENKAEQSSEEKEELDALKKGNARAIEKRKEELTTVHVVKCIGFWNADTADTLKQLSKLRLDCRLLVLDQLAGLDTEKSCRQRRSSLLEKFETMQKQVKEKELVDKEAEIASEFERDIAKILEVEADGDQKRSAQCLGLAWDDMIVERQEAEATEASQQFPQTNSAEHQRATALINALSLCRTLQLDYQLNLTNLVNLQAKHKEIATTLEKNAGEAGRSPWLEGLEKMIVLYCEYSEGKKIPYSKLRELYYLDSGLLSDWDKVKPELSKSADPGEKLKGNPMDAFTHLRSYVDFAVTGKNTANEKLIKQFSADFLEFSRRDVDVAFYDGKELITSFPIRTGINSGQRMLDLLESFAGKDLPLLRALQVCVSQLGVDAFVRAAASDIYRVEREGLSCTVRRKSETVVEVTLAARVTIPDFDAARDRAKHIVLAYQGFKLTFILVNGKNGWMLEMPRVDERGALQWVTNIPTLTAKENDFVEIDLEAMCLNKQFFVARKTPAEGCGLESLYLIPTSVEEIREALEGVPTEKIEEALKEARRSPFWRLHRMIEKGADRKALSLTLEMERRVISWDSDNLKVTKLANGKVTFEGGETSYFPYREEGTQLDPLFLSEKPIEVKI